MSDYLVYWPDFAKDRVSSNFPTLNWYSDHILFYSLLRGDHLWLIAPGEAFDPPLPEPFLVQEFVVESSSKNLDDNPLFPAATFRYFITAQAARTRAFEPPLNFDTLLRSWSNKKIRHLTTSLQTPRALTTTQAADIYRRVPPRHQPASPTPI